MRNKNIEETMQSEESVEKRIDLVAADGIVMKMHHMQWLKRQPNRIEGRQGEMSSNAKETKKRNKSGRKGQRGGAAANHTNRQPKADSGSRPPAGTQSAWNRDRPAESLFPGAEAANYELDEELQLKRALAESLKLAEEQAAMRTALEQCRITEIEITEDSEEDEERLMDDDYWSGRKRNLPSAGGDGATICDSNNNSGHDSGRKTKIATNETKNVVERSTITSRKSDDPTERNEKSESASAPLEIRPLSTPVTPNVCDKFGRFNGYNEKHLFMGRGGRKKEQEYIQECQRSKVPPTSNATSQQSSQDPVKSEPSRASQHVPPDNTQINKRSSNYSGGPSVQNDKFHYTKNPYAHRENPSSNGERAKSMNSEPKRAEMSSSGPKKVELAEEKRDWSKNSAAKRQVNEENFSNDENVGSSYTTSSGSASSQPRANEATNIGESFANNPSDDRDTSNLSLRDVNSRHNPPKNNDKITVSRTPEVTMDSSNRAKDGYPANTIYEFPSPSLDYMRRNPPSTFNATRPVVDQRWNAPYERMLIYEPSLYNLLLQKQNLDGCNHAVLLPVNLRNQDNACVKRQPEVDNAPRNCNVEQQYQPQHQRQQQQQHHHQQQYRQEIPINAFNPVMGIPVVIPQQDYSNYCYAPIVFSPDNPPDNYGAMQPYEVLKNVDSQPVIRRMIKGFHTYSPEWENHLAEQTSQHGQFDDMPSFDSSTFDYSANQPETMTREYDEATATNSYVADVPHRYNEHPDHFRYSDERCNAGRSSARNYPQNSRIPQNRRLSSSNYGNPRVPRDDHNAPMNGSSGKHYARGNENSRIPSGPRGRGRSDKKR